MHMRINDIQGNFSKKACQTICYIYPFGTVFYIIVCGRLAQLVRVPGLHPVGRGFESLVAHHFHINAQVVEW